MDEFNLFWDIWPNRTAKKAAQKAFSGALKRAGLATILKGVETYKACKEPWRAWMQPATFLNGDRWEDEYAAPPVKSVSLRGAAALAEDLKQEITNAGLGRPEGSDHQAGEQLRLERFQLH